MAKKKVGELIREARTEAGLTQEQLARKVAGISAADISKAERGELALNQTQLKAVAKAAGVTQKSLLDASKGSAAEKGTSSKKKTGKTAVTAANLTAAEKKLVELYRAADSDTKKTIMAILKGEKTQAGALLSSLLGGSAVKDAVAGMFTKK